MTDQDPTQRYQPPPADPAPAPEPAAPTAQVPPAAAPVPPAAAPVPPAAAPVPPAAAPTAAAFAAPPPPAAASFAAPPPPPDGVMAAPTVPVEPATASPRRGGRLKWIVAGVVTILVAGTAAGATWMLTRDAGSPAVMDWAPADSIMYAELRLDLPGDQEAELASVMSAFPGFDDQAAFDIKLGEALDELVGTATDGKHDYQTWIEPWFGGQLSTSIGPFPAELEPGEARALLLASVTDEAKAAAWAESLLAESGATSATETYNGVVVTTVTPPAEGAGNMTLAYAVPGPVLALGDLDSVKAAIDTNGGGALTKSDPFSDALASVPGDRLGFAYVDAKAVLEGSQALIEAAGDSLPMAELPSFATGEQAPWVAMSLRADEDAFVVETRSPHVATAPKADSTESTIAAVAPPSTVFLVTAHDIGSGIDQLKTTLAEDPSLAEGIKQIEDALAILGGLEAITGWMGDAGVAITRDGDTVAGGLLVTPTDPEGAEAAGRLLTQLKGFVALAGGSSGISVADQDYKGTTITTITIENVGALAGMAAGGSVSGVPDTIEIAYAATDDVVALGYTSDFVKAVLDAKDGESLADTERFSSLLERADVAHAAMAWIDIVGIRGLVEGMIPDEQRAEYDADAKPYLEAFDAMIATSAPGEDLDESTIIIRVAGD
jgi:hypothetical protein